MKKIVGMIVSIILVFSLTGCSGYGTSLSQEGIDDLEDGYVCEYRYGRNAKYSTELVDIDFEFDKQMFIDLYNEKSQSKYNSVYLRRHIENCDLKLKRKGKKIDKMLNSAISIRAAYEDTYKEVVVYKYNNDLYFFVLSMGGRTEKDKEGYYFMKVSDNLQDYWKQLTNQIYKE